MPYHVFIEQAVDATPGGRERLAAVIAAKYRLPEPQVNQYLAAGRFRVKSNTDEATARRYATELQAMGAVVSVIDAGGGPPLAVGGAPARAPAPAAAPAAKPAAPAAAPGSPKSGKFESGLAAAFAGGDSGMASLGALDSFNAGDSMQGFALSSIDGAVESAAEPSGLSAPPPDSSGINDDAFKAPDNREGGEAPLELAGPAPSAKKKSATPRPMPAAAPPPPLEEDEPEPEAEPEPAHAAAPEEELLDLNAPPATPMSSPGMKLPAGGKAPTRTTPRPMAAARAPLPIDGGPLARLFAGKPPALRLVAGLVLALVLGYLPATLYASSSESTRYHAIRGELLSSQSNIQTHEQWEALDAERAEALSEMGHARGRIRITTAMIWLAVGGLIGFAWFRFLV